MKRFFIGLYSGLALLVFGAAAQALSCFPPDMAQSFQRFDAADELYRVYQGRWQALEPIPSGDRITDLELQENGSRPTIRYRFLGRSLGLNGVTGRYQLLNVEVTPQCLGPWCSGYPDQDGQQIVFLHDVHEDGRLLRFEPGPCGDAAFPATQENVDSFVTCLNGGPCGDGLLDGDPPRPYDPQRPIDTCGATGLLTEFMGERIESVPFGLWPRRVRFIRPGDMVTMDHAPDRLNVDLSHGAIIQGFRCG